MIYNHFKQSEAENPTNFMCVPVCRDYSAEKLNKSQSSFDEKDDDLETEEPPINGQNHFNCLLVSNTPSLVTDKFSVCAHAAQLFELLCRQFKVNNFCGISVSGK